jgi:autotransporter-associated beta strand protein
VNNNANWQDTNGNQTVFNFGDAVAFNDFYGGGQVTLTGPYLSAASVTVTGTSSTPYTFAAASTGSFAGPGSLIYNGSVRLNINNANTYSGGTIISNAGAYLYLGNLSGLGTGPLTLAGGTMEIVPAGGGSSWISANVVVADNFTIQFDGTGTYAGYFTGNFSGTTNKTLTFVVPAGNTTTNERIRISGVSTTFNANLALNSSLLTLAPYNATSNQTYNGVISGAGGIIQRGSGTTILNGANTYSGGTTPTTGAIGFGTGAAIGTGPLYLAPEVGDITGSGEVFASGGPITITNSIQYPSATNNLTLTIGGANNLTFSGPFTLNGNDGLGTNNIRTIQITNTGLTTISGVISDGGFGYGLIETGNGTNATGPLALSNTETYTGPTTVSGGTLQVNGSLNAASAVTVSSNATLAGTGIINGKVTVNASGTLAPGTASAIGTLTLNGGLTLNGNLLFKVKKLVSPSNDVASVSGALTNGGTGKLTVMNLGPALAVGDKFKLFNKPLTNGAALTVTGAGAVWVNNLQVDGSISVSSTNLPQPVITTTTTILNGTSLVFSGTNGTVGATYYVLTSTNLILPLSSWTPIFTNTFITGGAFSVTNAISPSVPQRFYILILP